MESSFITRRLRSYDPITNVYTDDGYRLAYGGLDYLALNAHRRSVLINPFSSILDVVQV